MKSNFAKKQITMLTLVLALAAAVYLNWRFAGGENVLSVTGASSGEQTQATAGEQTQPVQTDAPGTEAAQTDAQQSEPAEGGAIGLLRDGDVIAIDIPGRTLDVKLDEATLAKRRAEQKPWTPRATSGWLRRYSQLVGNASSGATLQ